MQQLTNLDASWILAEDSRTPFHIANLLVFDKPDPAAGDPFVAFRQHLDTIAYDLQVFHRKLDPTSLKLANPLWIDDPDIDLDYHVKRLRLDKPGTKDQLNALIAQIHEPMLDRRHPLWQAWFIEGLEDGGFAVYLKLHHAAVDGAAVNFVLDVMFEEPEKAAASRWPLAHDPQGAWRKPVRTTEAMRPLAELAVDMPSLRTPYFTNLASMMESIKFLEDLKMTRQVNPFVNLWLSNIPAPASRSGGRGRRRRPTSGFRCRASRSTSPRSGYLDSMDFGVIGCAKAVPDAQHPADLTKEEYAAVQAEFV